jgi:hypothetical protein
VDELTLLEMVEAVKTASSFQDVLDTGAVVIPQHDRT